MAYMVAPMPTVTMPMRTRARRVTELTGAGSRETCKMRWVVRCWEAVPDAIGRFKPSVRGCRAARGPTWVPAHSSRFHRSPGQRHRGLRVYEGVLDGRTQVQRGAGSSGVGVGGG
eukprot:scaffold37431_cov58-Phaeocystis_antarctica.AAC.1